MLILKHLSTWDWYKPGQIKELPWHHHHHHHHNHHHHEILYNGKIRLLSHIIKSLIQQKKDS